MKGISEVTVFLSKNPPHELELVAVELSLCPSVSERILVSSLQVVMSNLAYWPASSLKIIQVRQINPQHDPPHLRSVNAAML